MRYFFPPREPFNFYSHLAGAILAIVWLFFLMEVAGNTTTGYKTAFIVYGISVFLMFMSSAIYHTLNVSERWEEIFRQVDHIMIYVVIAGSYTPICVIALTGYWQIGMLLGIWLFAVGGIIKKIFWMNAPRILSTILYLLMGWIAMLIFPQIWDLLPKVFSIWILAGGLFYTVGAIIYMAKKPNPFPETFGHHEIWHLFVMGGAFSHYWAIYKYLPAF